MTVGKIANGTVVDPANHSERTVGDVWFQEGRICEPPADDRAQWTFDATGMFVMPGGIDMHSHFVGPKVNAARRLNSRVSLMEGPSNLQQERPFVPELDQTGLCYAGLGYTTAFDAAVSPAYAKHTRQEVKLLPCVDAGFFALVGNHRYLLDAVAQDDSDRVREFLKTVISKTGAWAAKLVNPGGVEDWKGGYRDGVNSIDQRLHAFSTTPRQIIHSLAAANDHLGMPHGVHIHCNRLGLPGNWETTLDTMKALGDSRGHLAHVQFHSYRGADDEASFGSATAPLVDYVNQHKNLSVDVGQIMFGKTMSMTADSALGYYLQKISGQPWISHDTEQECGCGISPIRYQRKDRIHGLQWAIGLEWMLRIEDPWQLALSTDHPNGASFLCYPRIVELLMNSELRREQIRSLHDGVREHSNLYDMDREYTVEEIATITRAAPARLLGLCSKGHLGVGADADIAVYPAQGEVAKMFAFPRLVIKGGEVVIDDGELIGKPYASLLSASPDGSINDSPGSFERWAAQNYSVRGFA